VQIKAKSAGILGGLRAFLTKIGADKRLLQAVYHYGAPPRAVRRSDESVLNCPFPEILHKKFPKCVSIPGI